MSDDLHRAIHDAADRLLRRLTRHRDRYVRAWIAATGLHPRECQIVERHTSTGIVVTVEPRDTSPPLRWTRERPTVEGGYRVRGIPSLPSKWRVLADVFRVPETGQLWVQTTSGIEASVNSLCFYDTEWAGPIPEPEEPKP